MAFLAAVGASLLAALAYGFGGTVLGGLSVLTSVGAVTVGGRRVAEGA